MLGEMMIMLQQLENTHTERHIGQGLPDEQPRKNGHAYKTIKWLKNAYAQRIKRRAISVKKDAVR
tara:strand:+ start:250 stop:444 length:195 start_codon:yes stop_codon:yes gene_type:complete